MEREPPTQHRGAPSKTTTAWQREDWIDFGELPSAVNALLQRGVLEYRASASRAEKWFREALALAPDALPVYFCLYKIHTYGNELERALAAARAGLAEAARQAGWPEDFDAWPIPEAPAVGAERFALYTLKAFAFIQMKRGERREAGRALARLSVLDPAGSVGWRVIDELFSTLR
jgi:hypothetical protein